MPPTPVCKQGKESGGRQPPIPFPALSEGQEAAETRGSSTVGTGLTPLHCPSAALASGAAGTWQEVLATIEVVSLLGWAAAQIQPFSCGTGLLQLKILECRQNYAEGKSNMIAGTFLHCPLSCAQVRAPALMEPTWHIPVALGTGWLQSNRLRRMESGSPKFPEELHHGLMPLSNMALPLIFWLSLPKVPLPSLPAACPDPHPCGCQDPFQRPDGAQQGERVSAQQNTSERWVYPDSPCPAQWQHLLSCQHLFGICGNSLLPLLPLCPSVPAGSGA